MLQDARQPKLAATTWLIALLFLIIPVVAAAAAGLIDRPEQQRQSLEISPQPSTTQPAYPSDTAEYEPPVMPEPNVYESVQGNYHYSSYENLNGEVSTYQEFGTLVPGPDGPQWHISGRPN